MRRHGKNNNRAGKICISMILLAFMVVMSIQTARIYHKNLEYMEKQAELEAELESELARKNELENYAGYTMSQQYVEDIARSKLGLAYGNEIIFKEKK